MATKASRIALAGSNISSTGEVDADLLDNIDSAAFLSLDSNGRLGIGTSSPNKELHLLSSTINKPMIKIESTGTNSYPGFQIVNDSQTWEVSTHGGHSDALTFYNGSTHTFALATNGNVGIGTTSPSAILQITPPNEEQNSFRIYRGGSSGYQLNYLNMSLYQGNVVSNAVSSDSSGKRYIWQINGTEAARIEQDGTVSIQQKAGTTDAGVSGASGGSLDLNGGTAFAGRVLFTGYNDSGSNLIGLNNESSGLVMYDYTDSQYIMRTNNDQKVSFGGGFPNVNGSSNGVYNVIVDDGICIGDGGYTHGYIGTNGTDGDVYIAANAYPANLSSDRSVRIAGGSPGGGGPNEIVRYNHSHGAIRNYNNNTTTNKKWWSTTSGNFGEVEEYDYGNKLYFKKTRAVAGYSQVLLLNRYMPNQFDVSFELVSPLDTTTYRHFGIALNHVGSEAYNFDYVVLRQHFTSSNLNAVRIDRPAGTVGTSQGSSIPNFHDGTKRKIMIQKRASTFRMQVHELNGSVYTYGTISGISWTNSSGYFGFAIYESTGTNTWAKISNLTITDVIG